MGPTCKSNYLFSPLFSFLLLFSSSAIVERTSAWREGHDGKPAEREEAAGDGKERLMTTSDGGENAV